MHKEDMHARTDEAEGLHLDEAGVVLEVDHGAGLKKKAPAETRSADAQWAGLFLGEAQLQHHHHYHQHHQHL